jgi:dipeptidyl aminopeptidase/acylaminoacyl peptidase
MRVMFLTLVVSVCLLPFAVAIARETHPFDVRDLVAFDRLSEPRVSPDGRSVAFTMSSLDLEANRRRSHLWLTGLDGSGLKRLTAGEGSDTAAAWAPDGKAIYFLSTRGGSSQVWRLPLDGGEARPITALPLDVSCFNLSPDGSKLAVAMDVFPGTTPTETKRRLDETAARKASGKIYDQLFIRHWDEWRDGRRSHVFVLPASGGDAIDVMKAMDADSPTKPFGGSEEFTFTPDGTAIVFTAKNVGREEAWSTNADLFVAPADGAAAPRNITSSNPAWDGAPVFSPNGKSLAWLAQRRAGYESDRFRIMVQAWPDGAVREIAPSWDRWPEGLAWAPDGKTIFCAADDRGNHPAFAIDVATGTARDLSGPGKAASPQAAGDRVVFLRESMEFPAELFVSGADGKRLTRITHVNDERLASVRVGALEEFTFKGAGGDTVHGWVVKPADFDPSKKYPVAFLIHGGPQGSWDNDFHYRWNPQAYAGRGYAAVMVDFHGSTGYGQPFIDAINGDWGGKPLEDLKKGLEAALQKNPWMDAGNVCALGASYGGWMINWIAGNWPDRFKCLVAHDGNLDERFAYYSTEELWFPEWEHGGTPWANPAGYEKQNPVNFVKNWKTPILVVHGGKDFRVVATSGIGTFTAAQRLGIPSKLLYFPDENHWVLKPQNSILWHDTVLDWLDRWTGRAK